MTVKILAYSIMLLLPMLVSAQTSPAEHPPQPQSPDSLQNISMETTRIARAVENMNRNWRTFFDNFSTNQGLRLNERQQQLILALEVLNRLEQSAANMQKLKLELVERQSRLRMQLATVLDDLLPQSIERYVSARGSMDVESIREIRRQALNRERIELTNVLNSIQRELDVNSLELSRTELQIRSLRSRVFGQIEQELAGF